jgi:type IV secretory pathway VirB10-like protein
MGIFNKFINRYKKQNPDIQQDNLNNQNIENQDNENPLNIQAQNTVEAEKPKLNKSKDPNSKVPYIGIKKEVMVVGVILVVILFFIIYFASQINIEAIFSGKPAKKLAVSKVILSQAKRTGGNSHILTNLTANNITKSKAKRLKPNNNVKKTTFVPNISGKTVPSIPVKNGFNPNKANSSGIVVIGSSSSVPSSAAQAVNPALALQERILKGMTHHPNIPPSRQKVKSINQKNKNFLKNRAKNQSIVALVSPYHSFKFKKPFVITPGTLIPATLETGVNSQLPGPITAIVSSNVYSHDLKYLLIPTGSLLIGQYDSSVGAEQTRVLLAFTLVIFPDGKELQLPGFEGVSHRGYAGMQDIVDNHFWSIAKDVSLLTLIGFGVNESAGTGTNMYPTPAQSFAESLSTNLGQVAETILSNQINMAPTLKIKPGFTFNIVVTKNMLFKKPYEN